LQHCSVQPNVAQRRIGLLTPTEQLVLALIGDGSDDVTASARLGLKPASIQSVRRSLHGKLHLKQKGELVSVAAQYGFIRFTRHGVIRIGLGALLRDYQQRSKRPVALSPELAAEYPDAAEAACRRSTRRPIRICL
jgi:DNA-binding CsgD family transcriptional regulator